MPARVTLLLIAVIAAMTAAGALGTSAAARPDKVCSDFSTQAAAQKFFNNAGGPKNDPHRLDRDKDGIACESNPCPCSDNHIGGGGNSSPAIKRQKAKIIRVLDGDTVAVKLTPGPKAKVRLLGIDTPEMPNHCGAAKAKKKLTRLLPRDARVRLVSDPTQSLKDRYGRLLRYVIIKRYRIINGIPLTTEDTNLRQIRLGMAKVLVVGKPFQRVEKYRTAQTKAKNQNRGLWKTCY